MATHNGRKINWRSASRIAELISNKAFEHLIGPLEKSIAEIAEPAMRCTVVGIHATALIEARVLLSWEASSSVEILPLSYELPERSGLTVLGHFGFIGAMYSTILIRDDYVYEKLLPLVTQRNELQTKRAELYNTIEQQIAGKTVSAVRKAWPEAAPLIDSVFSPVPEITKPLEQLLARFLPMLPAPQAETEGV